MEQESWYLHEVKFMENPDIIPFAVVSKSTNAHHEPAKARSRIQNNTKLNKL